MTPALSYLRVSGLGQVGGDGFERQREAIGNFADKTCHVITQEYLDQGVSGTTDFDAREGLNALMLHVRSNYVRVVIVERMDRIARDLVVGELILAEFRKLEVKVLSADGGVDLTVASSDPTAIFIRQILGAVAQLEKTMIVSKLAAARGRKRKAEGKCEGRKFYGYHPGEAAVLERIRLLAAEGMNAGQIASVLNMEGLPAREGGPWHRRSMHNIVKRLREGIEA